MLHKYTYEMRQEPLSRRGRCKMKGWGGGLDASPAHGSMCLHASMKKAERVSSSSFAKFRPLITPNTAFRHAEARGECAGRERCLVHSSDNCWACWGGHPALKVSKSSTQHLDRQSTWRSQPINSMKRDRARDGRTVMRIKPWRFTQRRFIVALCKSVKIARLPA